MNLRGFPGSWNIWVWGGTHLYGLSGGDLFASYCERIGLYGSSGGVILSPSCIRTQCLPRYPRLIVSLRMFYLLAEEKKESIIYDFLYQGYKLSEYRRVHANPMFEVNTPVWSQLKPDNLLPPLPVEGQAVSMVDGW